MLIKLLALVFIVTPVGFVVDDVLGIRIEEVRLWPPEDEDEPDEDGMNQVTNMASRASTAPNRNGGPGRK